LVSGSQSSILHLAVPLITWRAAPAIFHWPPIFLNSTESRT